MSIKCGNCKEYHETTQDVRSCYGQPGHPVPCTPVPAMIPGLGITTTDAEVLKQGLVPALGKWEQVMADVNWEISESTYYHNIGRVATENQVNFVESLLVRRVHELALPENHNVWLRSLPMKAISILISALKEAPVKDGKEFVSQVKGDLPEVPAGRYAVTGTDGTVKFYKVDRPIEGRWAGYVFVKVQAGDDYHKVPAQRAILNQIAEQGAEECMLRYGRELGHCGHCGRTLTNDESRKVGIGPICREKVAF